MFRTFVVLTIVCALVACERAEETSSDAPPKPDPNALTAKQAEEAIRALGDPEPTKLAAFGDEELEELERAGLIEFQGGFKKKISVTESGKADGLEIHHRDEEFERIFGPAGVEGELCRSRFDRVAEVDPLKGPRPAARVTYHLRNEPRPLYARMSALTIASEFLKETIASCDPSKPVVKEIVLVKREDGWRQNRIPEAAGGSLQSQTNFEYDDVGRVKGAITVFKLTAAPTDPDGDPVTSIGWDRLVEFDADAKSMIPSPRMKADGLTVRFERIIIMGAPVGGVATYKVRDPWEETSIRFCAEGGGFGC